MWLEIFRKGKFTDSVGRTIDYTSEMLNSMVYRFNFEKETNAYSAPLVKGHPQTDSPAHGWVERLARRGNIIYAKLNELSTEIIDDVRSGKFKKVSVAIYPDLLLKHIGLLGAAQPAVQGLAPAEFDDTSDAAVIISDCKAYCYSDNDSDDLLLIENIKLKSEIIELKNREKQRNFRAYAENFFSDNPYIHKSEEIITQIADLLIKTDTDNIDESEFAAGNALSEDIIRLFNSFKPANLFAPIQRNHHLNTENVFAGKQVDERKMNIHNSAVSMLAENPEMTYEQAVNQILAS